MIEYTFADIIMDPEDPRLEGAIGKECYFSDYPKKLLDSARNNSSGYLDCLTNIVKEGVCPFVDKKGYGRCLIIIKKEESKKYVPFESIKEFVDSYTESREEAEFGSFEDKLYRCGMWLKEKATGSYYIVTELFGDGVVIGDRKMETTKEGKEYVTINKATSWEELLMDYCFLDGTPFGKEVEE